MHYGVPDPDGFEEVRAERRVKLDQVLAEPKHREHKAMLRWVGGTFDSVLFDMEATNKASQAVN